MAFVCGPDMTSARARASSALISQYSSVKRRGVMSPSLMLSHGYRLSGAAASLEHDRRQKQRIISTHALSIAARLAKFTSATTGKAMTKQESVDLQLVAEIMQTIDRYYQEHPIAPHPCALRDNLLVAAALLHRDCAKHDSEQSEDGFGQVAQQIMRISESVSIATTKTC